MLSVPNKPLILSAIKLIIVMLSVVAPERAVPLFTCRDASCREGQVVHWADAEDKDDLIPTLWNFFAEYFVANISAVAYIGGAYIHHSEFRGLVFITS